MKNFQITISSDKIEAIAKFQEFLDRDIFAQKMLYHVRIDNDFEDSKEYGDYLK
jgi:hypothetical protein|tara:strand:- start:420 stop:581 length:162 start_codon:yes stop_codon:yes gene_type:complete